MKTVGLNLGSVILSNDIPEHDLNFRLGSVNYITYGTVR